MWEMEQAGATAVEFRQAVVELQGAARAWQEQLEDSNDGGHLTGQRKLGAQ